MDIKNNDKAIIRTNNKITKLSWYSENTEYKVYWWMGDWALSNDRFNRGIRKMDAIIIKKY
jgi:hypothetical protein